MLLLNIASKHKAQAVSYDVKGAFLHAKFEPEDERIYLAISADIAAIWIEIDPTATEFIDERGELLLELDRYVYGLKQSPYKFMQHIRQVLLDTGYIQNTHDECLYYKRNEKGFSVLSIHVDDILQVSDNQWFVTELHNRLIEIYGDITFHPNADSYIGLSLQRSHDLSTFTLTQKGLIDKTILKYLKDEPLDTRKTKYPADSKLFYSGAEYIKKAVYDEVSKRSKISHQASTEADDIPRSEYLGLIMSLMYIARLSRPDILLPVTFLATRSHIANTTDMSAAKKVLRYLRDTRDEGLILKCDSLQLNMHCDASYGVHTDGKSHTGYAITLGKLMSYVVCKSAKQKLVSSSSTEAEILAMVDCLKAAI
jgi:hypothetical protein